MIDPDEIPEVEPTEITAGDTIRWTRDLSDFPASAWTLTYYLFGRYGKQTITATADGDEHSVTVSATDSQAYQPGEYTILGRAVKTSNGQTHEIYRNTITVLVNPVSIPETFDNRSHARKCLDAIEAVLEGRASRSDRSYQITGRSLEHLTHEELMDARARYKQEVAAEEDALNVANGGKSKRTIYTKFTCVR